MLIGSIVLVALLLIVLQLTGSDWAAGAMRVGIVAGILALLILLITVVRMILGRATKSKPAYLIQLISAVLVILLLSLLCLVGLKQQSVIHNLQARSWEGQQQWQSAINQYQLSGEGAPICIQIRRLVVLRCQNWSIMSLRFRRPQRNYPNFLDFTAMREPFSSSS
jgi:hypothetical protein